MSWQAYVDSSLVGSGHIDKGAIISAAGDSTWANSAGFEVTDKERKELVTLLSGDQAAVDRAHAEGLYVAGTRYVATKIEDRSVYGRQGKTGVAIVKTTQAILVGHYGEQQVGGAGNAAIAVEGLADYLIGSGY